ncbi:hypothetical protein ACLOJK_014655, partial [Asimina triloba]
EDDLLSVEWKLLNLCLPRQCMLSLSLVGSNRIWIWVGQPMMPIGEGTAARSGGAGSARRGWIEKMGSVVIGFEFGEERPDPLAAHPLPLSIGATAGGRDLSPAVDWTCGYRFEEEAPAWTVDNCLGMIGNGEDGLSSTSPCFCPDHITRLAPR